jgi:hypothetical protein
MAARKVLASEAPKVVVHSFSRDETSANKGHSKTY